MNLNFFKKLQNKILVMLILSTIIPVSIIGWYGTYNSTQALTDSALNQINYVLTYNAEKIQDFLDSIDKDVLFLSKVPPVQKIAIARENKIDNKDNLDYQNWTNQLNAIFLEMAKVKPYYMQLRYLDENGNEMVRVDSDGVEGKVIPTTELQNKAQTEYFIKTMQLKTGEVYVSPVNLNREKGKIEVPYKPVIRYSTPIYGTDGKQRGIVVANVFAKAFIESIKNIKPFEGSKAFLVNSDGYYLYHPDASKEWGFELNNQDKIEQNYPVNVAKQILSNEKGSIYEETPQIISFRKIYSKNKYHMIIISESPKSVVFASINTFKSITGMIILLCLAAILPVELLIVNKLTSLVGRMINNISSFSTQMVCNVEEQQQIAAQQASAVNQTSTTIDEIGASSSATAQQADSASTASRQVLNLTEHGNQAVQRSIEGMKTLEKKVGAIANSIVLLNEQTTQIGNISKVVTDLANQTNMLALNAAVEAVRAGEQGKGFSIVAAEIRKLADQSKKSAEKINILVTDIQKAINSTIIATDAGTQTVKDGVYIAQETAEAFKGVASAIDQVVVNNQQIALNAKQQAIAIEQVISAMNAINSGAQQTATGITQTKVGIQRLNEAAQALKAMGVS